MSGGVTEGEEVEIGEEGGGGRPRWAGRYRILVIIIVSFYVYTEKMFTEKEAQFKLRATTTALLSCVSDSANIKQLVVFVRYVFKRKPYTSFLQMVHLEDGKASTIAQSLLSVLRRCEIPVFGFGSDGAAVMVGRHSGVAAQLKEHNTEIVSLHCGAHRLALASSQAAQHVPYLKTFESRAITSYGRMVTD